MGTGETGRLLIRGATIADSANLAALAVQVWLHTYAGDGIRDALSRYVFSELMPEKYERIIESGQKRILVAISADHLVGFTTVDFDARCPVEGVGGYEVATLYVQPHFKGRGIGTLLLDTVRGRYGERMWLSTWVRNTPAIGFYEKYGFRRAGFTVFELYGEKPENVVLTL